MPLPKRPSIESLLTEQGMKLDRRTAEVSSGIRSGDHFDQMEERIQEIATGLCMAFRKGNAT